MHQICFFSDLPVFIFPFTVTNAPRLFSPLFLYFFGILKK